MPYSVLSVIALRLVENRRLPYCRRMFVDPISIQALQDMLADLETLISTEVALQQTKTARCLELIRAARALTTDMVKRASRIQ